MEIDLKGRLLFDWASTFVESGCLKLTHFYRIFREITKTVVSILFSIIPI